MSPRASKKQIERLEAYRDKLRGDLVRLQEDMEAALRDLAEEANHDDRIAEIAALAIGRDMDLSMEEHVRLLINKVEKALDAAEKGTYGTCESCGQRIPRERLEAVPWAAKCVECKRAEEMR